MVRPPVKSKSQRQNLVTKPSQRLALTPAIRQSLRLMSWRNHQITRFVRDLAANNPFIEVEYPASGIRKPSDPMLEMAFSAAMAADRVEISLTSHLMNEIAVLLPSGRDRAVALALVEHISPAGWLEPEAEATAAGLGMTGAEYDHLIARLQNMEPTGLFARNLAECLMLQLKDRGDFDAVMERLLPHLSILLEGGMDALINKTGLSRDQLQSGLSRLRQLDPKPGARFQHDDGDIFRPDIIVSKRDDRYDITLNKASLPSIRLAEDVINEADLKPFLQKARAEVNALNAALSSRASMLMALTGFVVTKQARFMQQGDVALEPLTMITAAGHLNCHASTVTRLVKDKLILTPRGMVPLADFFSPGITNSDGKDIASRAVSARIVAAIESEEKSNPLTDPQLVAIIKDSYGLTLTPRAIAKQRARLHIAKASERRLW
jgi:RNA polymerase sigma-54 factor